MRPEAKIRTKTASLVLCSPYVTILQLPYPLRFSQADSQPLALEALATQMRVSRGFIRLCFDAGCPNVQGAISAGNLLLWLFENYEGVRAIAGLRPLAPVENLEPATIARLRRANALITLFEHARTRTTDWRKKRQLRLALEQVDRAADHHS